MPKRQTKRKVIIKYVGRNPDDPLALLEAIEEVFRPKDIEISVQEVDDNQSNVIPDEQLETQAREVVAKELDKRDTEVNAPELAPEEAKQRTRSWLAEKVAAGWALGVKILPTLQKVKELFE